jgi:glycosidase
MVITFINFSCDGPKQPVNQVSEGTVSAVTHPQWSVNANMYEVNVRQYTPEGTFNAFAQHLPRLKEMGVDILWFMPVTPIGIKNRKGTLGSYYSVKDYTAINPEYGTLDDFKALVQQIHDLGMYVIVDWVANHTAWDHPWTETNPDFYYKDEKGQFTPPHNTDWSDVIQLDYENKDLWTAMIADLSFWLREVNIDGFRCDVAYMVPTDFWNMARVELEKIKPVFMLAEADHPELKEYAFNAGYSWTSHHAMNRIARGDDDVSALDEYYFDLNMGNYPLGAFKINFIDNHDENSWAGTVFERLGDGMKAFAVLTNTVPGMPLIYSGQEAGLDKRLEFFEKDQIDWNLLPYEDFFRTLLALKRNNKALWNGLNGGPMVRIETNDDLNVFAFSRVKDKNKVVIILNLSPQPREVSFIAAKRIRGTYDDAFGSEKFRIGKSVEIEMKPWEFKVLNQ